MNITRKDRRDFWHGYLEATLWTGLIESEDGESAELDSQGHDYSELYDYVECADRAKMMRDCLAMLATMAEGLTDDEWEAYARTTGIGGRGIWSPFELAGHDFSLTRNGHGAGFWDRGAGETGERLTRWAKDFGESSAYGYMENGSLSGVFISG